MMILKTLIPQQDALLSLCAVCITDNNGGKIALTIIVSSLILLALGNWTWKKHFLNKKQRSQQK